MRSSWLILAVPLAALVLAIAAVAMVPGILNGSSPTTLATSIAAPSWKVGDRWTYNLSFAPMREAQILPPEMTPAMPSANESFVVGTLTETVAGSVSTSYGDAWNVTLNATFDFEPPQPIPLDQPMMTVRSMPSVSTSGFVWLRQSDLAPVYSWKQVVLTRNWTLSFGAVGGYGMMSNATYTLTYHATTQVWYRPPLAIFRFPLEENTTWNVTSNATVRFASTFQVEGPNVTFSSQHEANFTSPLAFAMRTGFFADVTTPAGTFRALPVSALRSERVPVVWDRDASAVMNLTGDMDLEMPHAFATAWFSEQTGNVVKTTSGGAFIDGPRVELDLVSYTAG